MLGELAAPEIEQFLRSETTGRIGCHADGRTYVVPVTYVYDGGSVYGHSADGLKLRMMRRNPEVCFEVDRVEDPVHWRSVIAWGRFEQLRGEEALAAMDLLIERLAPAFPEPGDLPAYVLRASGADLPSSDGRGVVLYRIRLSKMTGRFEKS